MCIRCNKNIHSFLNRSKIKKNIIKYGVNSSNVARAYSFLFKFRVALYGTRRVMTFRKKGLKVLYL